jgi:hypothetical protein
MKRKSRSRIRSRRRSHTRIDVAKTGNTACSLSLAADIQKSLQDVIQSVLEYHRSQIRTLREAWTQLLENSNLQLVGWKKFIRTLPNKYGFYEFRKQLAMFLNSLCEPIGIITKPLCKRKNSLKVSITNCQSFGSKEDTSDIDVTISGDCMYANLIVLKTIQAILRDLFQSSVIFHDSEGFQLKRVFQLFDVNFYLSNFAILRDIDAPRDLLSSYYISTDGPAQYRHAFSDDTESECDYDQTIIDIESILSRLDLDDPRPEDSNKLIDLISKLTKSEDEGYRTQGAFFHVVLMGQRKMNFKDIGPEHDLLFICSVIENLRFALSHPSSKAKYLGRVEDALRRMNDKILTGVPRTDEEIRQTLQRLRERLFS